jgi:hypothetical protein
MRDRQVITWQEARGYHQQFMKRKKAQLDQMAAGGGELMAGDNESILFLKKQARQKRQEVRFGGRPDRPATQSQALATASHQHPPHILLMLLPHPLNLQMLLRKEKERKEKEKQRELRELMDNPMSPEAIKARTKAKRKEQRRKEREMEQAEAEARGGIVPQGGDSQSGAVEKKDAKAGNMVNLYYLYEGLEPGYEYRLRVAAISGVGQGDWSPTTWSTMTQPTRPVRPNAPEVDMDSVTKTSMMVRWLTPHENGSAVIKFLLKSCHDGHVSKFNHNYTSIRFEDLEPGKSYSFQVQTQTHACRHQRPRPHLHRCSRPCLLLCPH